MNKYSGSGHYYFKKPGLLKDTKWLNNNTNNGLNDGCRGTQASHIM